MCHELSSANSSEVSSAVDIRPLLRKYPVYQLLGLDRWFCEIIIDRVASN